MGPIGMQEMIGLFVIALLLFGPKKLPELGRTLGKALSEFRRAKNELTRTFETHMNELEKETRLETTTSKDFTPANYSYPYDDYGRYEEPVPQVAASESHQLEEGRQMEESHPAAPVTAPEPPAAVPGTIARTNGVQPVTAIADQEHPS